MNKFKVKTNQSFRK